MHEEAAVRSILAGTRIDSIIAAVDGGWKDYLAEGRIRPPRTRANIVWDYMTDRALATVSPLQGTRTVDMYGSPFFIFDDRLVLRFKKHGRDLFTQNIRTEVQQSIERQLTLLDLPDAPYVSCGYILDSAEADIEKIVIVKRAGKTIEWWIDADELAAGQLAAGQLAPATPILPFQPSAGDQLQLPKIQSRKADETAGGDTE